MQKNIIVGQSGGPSCAINASLAGVIQAGIASSQIGHIYGMKNGIEGVIKDRMVDLSTLSQAQLETMKKTPAMALGSCRYKMPNDISENVYHRIAEIFEKYNIGAFFYIGGNDSMDTVLKLSAYFAQENIDIKVIGIPKTIDNDLMNTDHTPGFGSAARYLAITVNEIIRDTSIYDIPSVTILEIMGRNAGWLTLAAGMPYFMGGNKPDIIAIPEVPFCEDAFISTVAEGLKTTKNIVAVVSEGLRDENGVYIGESTKSGAVDSFGHTYLSGIGKYLECLVQEKIGCKVRSIEVNLMQRCAGHLASQADLDESEAAGMAGVQAALSGETAVMMAYNRVDGNIYKIEIKSHDIKEIANFEKKVPQEWFDFKDERVKQEVVDYILPLIQGEVKQELNELGLPQYFVLEQ